MKRLWNIVKRHGFVLLLAAVLFVCMTEFHCRAGEQGSKPQRSVGLAA